MLAKMFKCPRTGLNVPWQPENMSPPAEGSQTFTSVACPACNALHFIDQRTGRLLGDIRQ
jgi:endogenous inhibitor of DNA gyrase (YacG/DUF329 family)